ncbi:MAG: hypothetical protein EA403_01555 [Spirochaetaceae bacterium]|nr:MAG: hypothetical protein EA403_01555 [Spirochaetaceae bacterium]
MLNTVRMVGRVVSVQSGNRRFEIAVPDLPAFDLTIEVSVFSSRVYDRIHNAELLNAQVDVLGSMVPDEDTGEITIFATHVNVIEPADRSTRDRVCVEVAAEQWRYLAEILDSRTTSEGVAYLVGLPHLKAQIPLFIHRKGPVFYERNWEQRYELLPADLSLVDWERNDGREAEFLDGCPTVHER